MIELNHISLSFNNEELFTDLSLRIGSGENVCLSGDSGSGKTTLLKMMQGYARPDSGEILFGDMALNTSTIREIRDQIAWLPQHVNFPVKSGLELIGAMHLQPKTKRIKELMAALKLDPEIISKSFRQISGGQKQRLMIAICVSIGKPILLLDEPTTGLDRLATAKLGELLQSLDGTTLVSASHDQRWLSVADRVIEI